MLWTRPIDFNSRLALNTMAERRVLFKQEPKAVEVAHPHRCSTAEVMLSCDVVPTVLMREASGERSD